MELIPGLPNDVAVECLIRVDFNNLSKVASVSEAWKKEIQLREFWKHRKTARFTRPVVVMAQAPAKSTDAGGVYHLTVCDLERNFWNNLPPIPGFSHGLPVFCQIVGAGGTNLVVMGGCDPISWKVLNSVFIYDFLSSTWRSGADMPGRPRLFFGCASDSDRTVIVAGGHDEDKNALRSAMTYDVANDEWMLLPDMARERDECKCIFYRGKFHVIGGYCTERQGGFESHVEVFDYDRVNSDINHGTLNYVVQIDSNQDKDNFFVDFDESRAQSQVNSVPYQNFPNDRNTRQWSLIDNFLKTATCAESCLSVSDDKLYMWQDGHLLKRNGDTWTMLSELTDDTWHVSHLTAWQDKLVAIGCAKSSVNQNACYVINLSNRNENSIKIEVPQEYSGHILTACSLEI